jgi:hypothetical protein
MRCELPTHALPRKGRTIADDVVVCSEHEGFASSPLRGEDNDGTAQRCRREVGVIGQLTSGKESPPPRTASSIFVKDENRAALSSPLKGEEEKKFERVRASRCAFGNGRFAGKGTRP